MPFLEIKSCDGCPFHGHGVCRHPGADSLGLNAVPPGYVHEDCPLRKACLTLNVKKQEAAKG